MGLQRAGCDLATERQQLQEQADPTALVMITSPRPFREHDTVQRIPVHWWKFLSLHPYQIPGAVSSLLVVGPPCVMAVFAVFLVPAFLSPPENTLKLRGLHEESLPGSPFGNNIYKGMREAV